jgi:hypothetical protein
VRVNQGLSVIPMSSSKYSSHSNASLCLVGVFRRERMVRILLVEEGDNFRGVLDYLPVIYNMGRQVLAASFCATFIWGTEEDF